MIPLRTDRKLRRTPWVNICLIVANFLVYFITRSDIVIMQGMSGAISPERLYEAAPAAEFLLRPMDLHLVQFFTYQFLHGDIWHLAGNMVFLYVFGNCLEDRFGPFGYLLFYLAAGVIAGVGHVLTTPAACYGASGAVAGVTGGFLALFPVTRVTILWPFLIIFVTEWPSMYFILFAFAKDVIFQLAGSQGVAYMAHISGNVFGFVVGMALLWTRIVPREQFDFLALVDRWNRRRQHRAAVHRGYSGWQADAGDRMKRTKANPNEERIMELRSQLKRVVDAHDGSQASVIYEQLLELQADAVMSRDMQRDLAALAMQAGRHETAALAYEAYRAAYKSDPFRHEINLILGVLYARYLHEPDKARPLLEDARDEHHDEGRRAFAREVLDELELPRRY